MTEQEWLTSTDPAEMLEYVGLAKYRISDRKLRLFACACARKSWRKLNQSAKEMVEKVENEPREYPDTVHVDPFMWEENDLAQIARDSYVTLDMQFPQIQRYLDASLLREIVGNPFRPIEVYDLAGTIRKKPGRGGYGNFNCRWITSTVLAIAQGIYDERAFDRMPILHDALVDAGCDNEDVLRHLRGEERCFKWGDLPHNPIHGSGVTHCSGCDGTGWRPLRGPHVRGCHVIDLLLGKS